MAATFKANKHTDTFTSGGGKQFICPNCTSMHMHSGERGNVGVPIAVCC